MGRQLTTWIGHTESPTIPFGLYWTFGILGIMVVVTPCTVLRGISTCPTTYNQSTSVSKIGSAWSVAESVVLCQGGWQGSFLRICLGYLSTGNILKRYDFEAAAEKPFLVIHPLYGDLGAANVLYRLSDLHLFWWRSVYYFIRTKPWGTYKNKKKKHQSLPSSTLRDLKYHRGCSLSG